MNSDRLTQSYEQPTKDPNQAKSIFTSKTVWSIIFTTVAAIAPVVGKDFDKYMNKQPVDYGQDIAQVVVIMCGAAASIVGRVEAKDSLYTPNWLPGPNKTDPQKP